MKRIFILLVLFSISGYSQNTTLHFFYGSNSTLGAETMFKLKGSQSVWLGGGFSATTNALGQVDGTHELGSITNIDTKYKVDSKEVVWGSIYLVGSYDVVDYVIVKYKLGLGVYNNFEVFDARASGTDTPYTTLYNKFDGTSYKPLAGIGLLCPLSKDFGVEVGCDTFNYFTVGFTVLF